MECRRGRIRLEAAVFLLESKTKQNKTKQQQQQNLFYFATLFWEAGQSDHKKKQRIF